VNSPPHRIALRATIARALCLLIAAVWTALGSGLAAADVLEGALSVDSAFVNRVNGVYQLHARVQYPLSDDTRTALRDGVSLSYSLEVEIARQRRYWLDAGVTSIVLRRDLAWHAVSERYVVREVGRADGNGNGQQAFSTLEEALAHLGTIDGWPIVVAPQLRAGGEYAVSVRASVRRGRMPDALRVLLFWTDDWQRESEWYTWSLPR
jgi:hypothetical protein